MTVSWTELEPVLEKAKAAACEYYRLTGKPLGITGEMGEYWAARLLELELADVRYPGFDALDKAKRRIQIKARLLPDSKKLSGQMVGSIKLDYEWDAVMLVLMHQAFEPFAIYEVSRESIKEALVRTDCKARKRGVLSASEFKRIGLQRWPAN